MKRTAITAMKKTTLRVAATTVVLAMLTVASLASALGQEKSAAELTELLKTRYGAEWTIPSTLPEKVIACEQTSHKIMIFKSGADWNDPNSIVWEWAPYDVLPEDQAKWFNHVDECKPTLDGTAILCTASSGGAAMVRISDKKILFLGRPGGNTHSIARFPDGNIVTASSTGKIICLFVVPGEQDEVVVTPVFKTYELDGGHGVVWDAKRKLLWALGSRDLVGYEYVGTKDAPELKEVVRVKLVGSQVNGHDLYPAPGYDALMTTGRGINVFDPETRTFSTVANLGGIKSVSLSPDGVTLLHRADEEYWSDRIYFGDAKDTVVGRRDGARFYKARWFLNNEFSEPTTAP